MGISNLALVFLHCVPFWNRWCSKLRNRHYFDVATVRLILAKANAKAMAMATATATATAKPFLKICIIKIKVQIQKI